MVIPKFKVTQSGLTFQILPALPGSQSKSLRFTVVIAIVEVVKTGLNIQTRFSRSLCFACPAGVVMAIVEDIQTGLNVQIFPA